MYNSTPYPREYGDDDLINPLSLKHIEPMVFSRRTIVYQSTPKALTKLFVLMTSGAAVRTASCSVLRVSVAMYSTGHLTQIAMYSTGRHV